MGRGAAPVRGGGRGGGRAPGRPPIPPSAMPYRAPHPIGGRGSSAPSAMHGSGDEYGSSSWNEDSYEAEGDDLNDQDASNKDASYDKAEWTNSENNAAFCALCVEQIMAGNRSDGFMTGRAYKNIAAKFELIRALRHSKTQLKNIWEGLKRFYSFWLWLNKHTGLGRANGTVVASEKFWKDNTKGHAEWKKLKYGPPENLDKLEIMFEHIAVDGSTSCTPGQNMDVEGAGGEEGEAAAADDSPISAGSMKRGASSTSTTSVTSPKKRTRSPVVRIMKGMWESMHETNVVAQKAMQGEYFDARPSYWK